MNNQLSGIPSLAYLGTNATNPPNVTYHHRAPLTSDWQNFSIGDEWLYLETDQWYKLTSVTSHSALWVEFSGAKPNIETLSGNTGANPVTVDSNNNINVFGDGVGINISGNGSHTLTASLVGGGIAAQTFDGNTGSATPTSLGILNIIGSGSITTSASGNTITINSLAANSLHVQTFTSSGTYTPSVNMQFCIIEVVGAGGGAGGVASSGVGTCAASAGGGGGGYSRGLFSAATIGVSQTVTIGTGGTGGTGAVDGTNGGTTSVGSLISATGGSAGAHGAVGVAGATNGGSSPGIGSSGQVNLAGNPGGNSWSAFTSATSFYICFTGQGGSSPFGGGGPSSVVGSSTSGQANGSNGSNYGGGGGGCWSFGGGTSATGGNGANGFVSILEFID